MKQEEFEQLIIEAIQEVAPEIELVDIDVEEDIRDECDLDSMDFINFLEALQKSTGVKISEADYGKLDTFCHVLAFLEEQQ